MCIVDEMGFYTQRVSHSGHAFRLLHDILTGAVHKKMIAAKDFAAPYIMLTGKPISLHVGASLNAYNKAGATQLRTYAREAALEMKPCADVFDYVDGADDPPPQGRQCGE